MREILCHTLENKKAGKTYKTQFNDSRSLIFELFHKPLQTKVFITSCHPLLKPFLVTREWD